MSQLEKLNNVAHADLRIITRRGVEFGDDTMLVPVYPNEMRAMQSCYPLLFFKEESDNTFHPIALLGFEQNENLFLKGEAWDAPYLPMIAQKGPMMISFDKSGPGGSEQAVMAIDVEHARVSRDEGEPLFLEQGGNSEYLDRLAQVMEMIHVGHQANERFVTLLNELELITPCSMKITLKDGSRHELGGFYMIDDEKLSGMDGAALDPLAKEGLLMPAFMMMASMSQLQALISRKNATLDEA